MPEKSAPSKEHRDLSLVGKLIKLVSIPTAIGTAYWTMDTSARGDIIAIETEASDTLHTAKANYIAKRSALANARDRGIEGKTIDDSIAKLESTAEEINRFTDRGISEAWANKLRHANHEEWRERLYENLKGKGYMGDGFLGLKSFGEKFAHLRNVDKQRIIIEGVTVGSIIIGAAFAVASSDIFKKQGDNGQSR